jgi:hypothetical protein
MATSEQFPHISPPAGDVRLITTTAVPWAIDEKKRNITENEAVDSQKGDL